MAEEKKDPMTKNQQKPAETISVEMGVDSVVCDGGVGPLGHPQVWYSFDRQESVSCHYCGRKFVKGQK